MDGTADKAVSRTSFAASEPQLIAIEQISACGHKSKNNKGQKTFAPSLMRDRSASGANVYFHSLLFFSPHPLQPHFLTQTECSVGKQTSKASGCALVHTSYPTAIAPSCRRVLKTTLMGIREDWDVVYTVLTGKISGYTEYTYIYSATTPLPRRPISLPVPTSCPSVLTCTQPHQLIYDLISTEGAWKPLLFVLYGAIVLQNQLLWLSSRPGSIFPLRSHLSALRGKQKGEGELGGGGRATWDSPLANLPQIFRSFYQQMVLALIPIRFLLVHRALGFLALLRPGEEIASRFAST